MTTTMTKSGAALRLYNPKAGQFTHLFPEHAKLQLVEGLDRVPIPIVSAVAEFVLAHEGLPEDAMLHAEILGKDIEDEHAKLTASIRNMPQDIAGMDYHDGRHYRRNTAQAFLNFEAELQGTLLFSRQRPISARRGVPPHLRRVFIHYTGEMKTLIPPLLERTAITKETYNVPDMAKFTRAAVY